MPNSRKAEQSALLPGMWRSSTCFVGRIIFREDRLRALDWLRPCPIPAENISQVLGSPDMFFCSPHFFAFDEALKAYLEQA